MIVKPMEHYTALVTNIASSGSFCAAAPHYIYTGAAALIYVEWGGSIFRVRVLS